jgi:acyl carrier protein phosphodiesterase
VNYLAHIYLAGPEPDAQIGALLGDFAKVVDVASLGHLASREILIHRAIDAFTDTHQVVLSAKSKFRPETRRFAGIHLDILYDHLLAQSWGNYSGERLSDFIDRFYKSILITKIPLPERLANLVPALVAEDWLGSYREFEGVELAVKRVSTRISKGQEAFLAGIDDMRAHIEEFSQGFEEFFPSLILHTQSRRVLASRVEV